MYDLGFYTVVGLMLYLIEWHDDTTPRVVHFGRRPTGIPKAYIRRIGQYKPRILQATLVINILMISIGPIWILRVMYAICCTHLDLFRFSRNGFHDHFLFIYVVNGMMLPEGPIRFYLTMSCMVYTYFASGLSKVYHGGFAWLNSRTLQMSFELFVSKTWTHSIVCNQFVRRRWWLCGAMSIAGLLMELVFVPALLFVSDHQLYVYGMVAWLVSFHMLNHLLMEISFVITYPCIIFIAISHEPEYAAIPTHMALVIFGVMVVIFYASGEWWPLNSMEIFPFNHVQMTDYTERFLRNTRLVVASERLVVGERIRNLNSHNTQCVVTFLCQRPTCANRPLLGCLAKPSPCASLAAYLQKSTFIFDLRTGVDVHNVHRLVWNEHELAWTVVE
jgi:hypothetical protein